MERVLVVKSQLHSVLGVTTFVSEGNPGNKEAVIRIQSSILRNGEHLYINLSKVNLLLTVTPESLWLGFYALEVDIKILPRDLSRENRDNNQHKNRDEVAFIQNSEGLNPDTH